MTASIHGDLQMTLANTIDTPPRIVREEQCRNITGLSRCQRWKMERAGQFPRRVPLVPGGAHHGWLMSEIENWILERADERPTHRAA